MEFVNGKNYPIYETEKNSYVPNHQPEILIGKTIHDPLISTGSTGHPTFQTHDPWLEPVLKMPGISVGPQEDPTRPTSPPGCPCPWELLGMSSTWNMEIQAGFSCDLKCSCCCIQTCVSMSSRNEINPYPGVKRTSSLLKPRFQWAYWYTATTSGSLIEWFPSHATDGP